MNALRSYTGDSLEMSFLVPYAVCAMKFLSPWNIKHNYILVISMLFNVDYALKFETVKIIQN